MVINLVANAMEALDACGRRHKMIPDCDSLGSGWLAAAGYR